MIASGLHGIEQELELEPPLEGNAYEADKPHVPTNIYDGPRPVRRSQRSPRKLSATRSSVTT